MEYQEGFLKRVGNLRSYLLGHISYEELEKEDEKTRNSYHIEFETTSFREFSKKIHIFVNDEEKTRRLIEHEKEHARISKKYGLKVKFLLKSYVREGIKRARPSVQEINSEKVKKTWSKKKFWKYLFDQVNRDDASDNDKILKKMLLEIRGNIR